MEQGRLWIGLLLALVLVAFIGCNLQNENVQSESNDGNDEAEVKAMIADYVSRVEPLMREMKLANWEANLTGSDEDFARSEKAHNALADIHRDATAFSKIKKLRETGKISDPLLARQCDIMYFAYLPYQGPPDLVERILALESKLEQTFNTHRGMVDGAPKTENELRAILRDTEDGALAEKAWRAYMQVGEKVDASLKELVQLRNELARSLGYANFHKMKLDMQEIDEAELMRIFDQLDDLTRAPFAELKAAIDQRMCQRFGISQGDIRPWHLGDLFFQEAPQLGEIDLDQIYADRDLQALAKDYYASLGMPVDDILARSDLYEKPGKSPHAFCEDMDRKGDVRVLCNLKPNAYWADTIFHELGHGVYDKYLDEQLPYLLRVAAHPMSTEGVAIMFGAMVKNEDFFVRVLGIPQDEAAQMGQAVRNALRAEKLIFSRWAQVMLRFEQAMYADPDQDLRQLWWDLKAEYQLQRPPDGPLGPDYGAKMHVVIEPAYYHNYLLGDLVGAQIHHAVVAQVLKQSDPRKACLVQSPEAGSFLIDKVFSPGKRMRWDKHLEMATEEPLSAAYYAELIQ